MLYKTNVWPETAVSLILHQETMAKFYKQNAVFHTMAQDDEEFKDMDEDKSKKPVQNDQQNDYVRVRMPRGKQVLGIVEQRLGGSRMRVRCLDGNTRVCRIPGRLKRRLWIREGDTILVEPWEISGDERGDVIFKYRYNQVKVLDKKGLLDGIKNEDEF